ncbi:MAG: DUF3313 domain-containing protein [Hyphomonadaceae bacterium]|nr:MAG: hypothetical protein FD160_1555 [Caulobacteraceae bacterium]MBT9446429.1 DUF3313 domain-containing protein [Hyphomonadaceae bacterium]TPW04011.1 MAG: hypothetical protein FD124_2774 [Alphaproteobacteria bacterium]
MKIRGHSARARVVRSASVVLFSGVILSACATPNVAQTGFLTSYEMLQISQEAGAVKVVTSPKETLAVYSSIIIDMATLVDKRLTPAQEEAMRGALEGALVRELGVDRRIVTEPMPGTLRVRYAITEVETSNVALNALTSAVIGAVDYGSLALEAEVVDAISGERIAAMTWARGAKATNVLGAYSTTGNARALAPDFAKRLARLVSPTMPG